MKIKSSGLLTAVILLVFISTTRTQSTYTIYYQNGDSIYGIGDESNEPSLIASNISQTVYFSNSGRYAAYHDSEGVWISRIDTWSPERVISILPAESFALDWTPDDTRLILRLAFWPEDGKSTEEAIAYNLLTESEETWIWGVCDQIAQHTLSKNFALICEAYEDAPQEQMDAIALTWGGEFSQYDPTQYEILLDGLLNIFPRPFDWGVTERGQNMTYIAENPNYRRENDNTSFWEIISLWNNGNDLIIDGPQKPEIERQFAVSNDRTLVAYTVFCGNPSDSCLQIMDLSTGELEWRYENTIRVERPFDIAWYPDNQRVALLGANSEGQHIIQVFDVETGDSVAFDVGNTSGIIAIS